MKNYHVITHTHWDREWYFTKEETKVLLRQHMLDLFDYLETDPNLIYILDGQSVMIDDFLELAPEYEETLRKYIQSGSIRVGPWYTQTDLMLTRGESIARNLFYGLKTAREYTENPMLVGYAPDTFGHNAQMPQVYNNFGIESSFFWQGVSLELSKNANFEWTALDGTKIYGHSLSAGYQGGKYLLNDIEDLKERISIIEEKYNTYGTFNNILVMNGHDQMPVQRDLREIMNLYNTTHDGQMINTDFESYLESILENETLDKVKGELYDAEFTRVHKTISSTRMDIKLLNTYVEDKIYNVLEPLSVIAYQCNIPYPHELIEKALKLLFGAHAHDSLGGCNTDEVNEMIYYRLYEAKELVDNQIDITLRQIGLYYEREGFDAFVVNQLPYKKEHVNTQLELQTITPDFKIYDAFGEELSYQIVEQNLIDMGEIDRQVLARRLDIKRYITLISIKLKNVPALSLVPLKIVEHTSQETQYYETRNYIENKYYQIDFDKKLRLKNKVSDEILDDFIFIENNGDGGDGYDYSPIKDDWIIGAENLQLVSIEEIIIGEHFEKVILNYVQAIPKDEEERIARGCSVNQKYRISITLYRDEPEIYVSINLKNKAKDQRTRLGIKVLAKERMHVISDCQFGNQSRPSVNPNLTLWEQKNWVEKPVSIEHFETYVTLAHENTFYARGLKEYEMQEDTLYFTLFRSFAYMGRSDLINRPGRASGMAVPTPLNQLEDKEFTFDFWLNYTEEKHPDKVSKELLNPLPSYQIREFNRFNINPFENLDIKEIKLDEQFDEIAITAVKNTLDDKILIRGYNPNSYQKSLDLNNVWFYSNMNEEIKEEIRKLNLNPYEIFTIIYKGEV